MENRRPGPERDTVALNRVGRLAGGFLERPLPDVCVQAPPVSDRDHPALHPLVCHYGISYQDLEEMMGERGVAVDHVA